MRSLAERVARGVALALIGLGIWRAFASTPVEDGPVRIEGNLGQALPGMTASRASAVHLGLTDVPTAIERDWLVAIRRTGTPVTWHDAGLALPTAIAVSSAPDPSGGAMIAVAAGDTGVVRISDALGTIDSLRIAGPGGRVSAPAVSGTVRIQAGGRSLASSAMPVARTLRPVLVAGSAGWEAKFIIAALEERGWVVHTRLRVSPTSVVSQGSQLPLDTARYSAIILLDSTSAVPATAVLRFLREGGGLVLVGDGVRTRALASIAPARPGEPIAGSLLRAASASGRAGLPMLTLVLRDDAVEIDRRDGRTVVAARREGAGRVIAVGETQSWRWRMSGGEGAPAEHRAWWSRIVASAAYAPLASTPAADADAAPRAALIDALGPPAADATRTTSAPAPALPWWMGVGILTLLLAEWASRRLRGER